MWKLIIIWVNFIIIIAVVFIVNVNVAAILLVLKVVDYFVLSCLVLSCLVLSCLVLIISPWKWLITAALCWKKRHLKQDTCWKHPLNQLRTDNFNFWQFQHFIWKHSTQLGFHNYETPQFVPNQSDYFFATNQRSLFQAAGNAQFNFWHFLWTRPDQIGQTISAEFQVHSLEPF